MKISNSFVLSIAGLASLVLMFLTKGLDTSTAIVSLCLGYIGARQAKKASDVIAAAKDVNADTAQIIREQEK